MADARRPPPDGHFSSLHLIRNHAAVHIPLARLRRQPIRIHPPLRAVGIGPLILRRAAGDVHGSAARQGKRAGAGAGAGAGVRSMC
jgi:hypothetical protein